MWHHELLRLDARTAVEVAVERDHAYRLALWRDGECIVEFHGRGGVHRRRSFERSSAYEFRSVEQLRYDFEREIEALGDRH